ncbi:MAG: M23 family metallopeptidase [Alphaproteobacteria bacterium]|nr:M23 family metallopeptidase [Alphaproteobacteria bacterium]
MNNIIGKTKKYWKSFRAQTEGFLHRQSRRRIAVVSAAIAVLVIASAAFMTRSIMNTAAQVDIVPEFRIPVKSGDTLSSLLRNFDMSAVQITEIDRTLRRDVKIRNLVANRDILRVFKRDDEPVERIILNQGPWRHVHITRDADTGSWRAELKELKPEIRLVRKQGVIRDGDSFYLAGHRANIPVGIITEAYDLFSFEIDFQRDVRAGQQFIVIYEEFFLDGKFVTNGSIVFAEFDTLRGQTKMYRFRKPSDGRTGYYDWDGKGAIKSIKRTPINNARVTSSFSMNRRHPVLGFNRAHRGVDFRAAHGTPIPAAGAGRVVRRGYDASGYGNFIQIRHGGSFETLYAHMSRFAPGVNVGTYVRQGQIVGFVGSTGVSSGPHLHYEIIQNGVRVNPMTVKLPAIDNLKPSDLEAFYPERDRIDGLLKTLVAGDPKSYYKVQ